MSSAQLSVSQSNLSRLGRIIGIGALWGSIFGVGLSALLVASARLHWMEASLGLIPYPLLLPAARTVHYPLEPIVRNLTLPLAGLVAGLLAGRGARSVWAGAVAGFFASLIFLLFIVFTVFVFGDRWVIAANYAPLAVVCGGIGALGGLAGKRLAAR